MKHKVLIGIGVASAAIVGVILYTSAKPPEKTTPENKGKGEGLFGSRLDRLSGGKRGIPFV